MFGVFKRRIWDVVGMLLACVWDVCGVPFGMSLGCVWDVLGKPSLGCVWYLFELFSVCVWEAVGMWFVFFWDVVGMRGRMFSGRGRLGELVCALTETK